jgi:CheY-like chemotaxis protein
VQVLLADSAGQITTSARAISRNAQRQEASIEIIAELERRAEDIGEITRTVSRISDQTNLLALNAAIEAARAGDDGRALRILQSAQRIDLLVTDIGLPGLNGRQLADAGRERRPSLKVLFMTGYAESAAGKHFLAADMEIVTQPFTMEALAVKIRKMIETKAEASRAKV